MPKFEVAMAYSSRLELVVDSRTGEARLRNFRTELGRTERAGSSAGETIGRTSRQIDGMATVTQTATRALTGLAGALSIREVIRYSDAWTSAGNRIRVYTDSVSEMQQVQSRLVSAARDTRSSFEATADLYAALARSNDELGLSQDKLIELTSTINKTFALSGVEAQAAAGAIRQLGQGLAAGALRGDEFNSVAEQAPDIMRAIAQSLGMAIGDLREFAATGGITAEIIVNALSEAREEIDGNFARSIATFGQNLENAQTNLIEFVGTSDTLAGATSALGGTIETLSENLETIADIAVVAGTVFAGRLAGGAAAAGASMAAAQVQALRYQAALASMAGASRVAAAGLGTLAAAARGASGAMAFLGGPVGLAVIAAGSLFYFRDEIWKSAEATKGLKEQLDGAAESMDTFTKAGLESRRAELSAQLEDMRAKATALAKELEAKRLANVMYQGRPGANPRMEGTINRELQTAQADMLLLENAIGDVDNSLDRLGETQGKTGKTTEQLAREARNLAEAWYSVRESTGDALDSMMERLGLIGEGTIQFRRDMELVQKAFALGLIDEAQADAIANAMNDPKHWEEAGKKSGEEFSHGFESQVDRVADSLQDAIASGNWAGIGATIGATLASSAAQVMGDQVAGSLGQGIAGAIGGPIVGAIAGGLVGLAAQKISDYFSDDWDPTEMRQAAQGTGTLLGSISEKSQSISKGMDVTASATSQLVGINRSMLRAMEQVNIGIQGASARVARGASGVSFGAPSAGGLSGSDFNITGGVMPLIDGTLNAAFEFFDGAIDLFTFGLIDLGKLLGGKSRQVDEGVNIVGGYIGDLVDDVVVQSFATFRVKKNVFSSTKTKEKYQNLGDEVTDQFSLVFESILDSVVAGAGALGIDASAASGFRVGTQKLSLEGLNAEQQQKELEAYFSTVFDRLSAYTVPWLGELQRAGEGLGETLARVATQTQTTQYAIDAMGIRFDDLAGRELVAASERLIEFSGGLEQFISGMQGFISNFATEAQQFELAQSNLNKAMREANLILPDTRQGYYQLMQAQNGSTEQGAENIATLLRLQGVADQYYSSLEDQSKSFVETQKQALQSQVSLHRSALSSAQRMADSVADALSGMMIGTPAAARVRREDALSSLSGMVSRGRVRDTDDLSGALSSATNINANDYASLNDYIREVARTGAVLTNLQKVTDKQVSAEQRSLEAIEKTLERMQQQSDAQQTAIAKHTAKTAKILERIEIEGAPL